MRMSKSEFYHSFEPHITCDIRDHPVKCAKNNSPSFRERLILTMSLKLFIGPMSSGKTMTLITYVDKFKISGRRYIIIGKESNINTRFCNMSIEVTQSVERLSDAIIPTGTE